MRKDAHSSIAGCRIALVAVVAATVSVSLSPLAVHANEPVQVMLRSALTKGSTAQVEVGLQVGGDILLSVGTGTVAVENKVQRVPMAVAAKLTYEEQLLAPRDSEVGTARAARRYQQARAELEIDKHKQQPTLAPEHALIGVDQVGSETILYSPQKQISREELDLIDVAANSLILDELLPNRQVAVGDSWSQTADQMAALLRLDAVSLAEVKSLLSDYDAATGQATISMAGTVHGAAAGVATEIEIKSRYTFSTQDQRIVRFALVFKEKRSIGHVGPGLDVVVKQLVVVKPQAKPQAISSDDLLALNQPADETAQRLSLASPQNGFRAVYDRTWYVTSDNRRLTVLRLVQKGELLAQCNLTPLEPITEKTDLSLAGFQKDIEKSLGERFGQFAAAKEFTDSQNRRVYRVVVHGKVAELAIQWIYYLITTPDGRRLSIAFSLEQSLAPRFGSADEKFVAGIEMIDVAAETAKQPTVQR